MAQGLMLFLILFPMAMAPVVFPLRRRDRGLRDRFIQLVPLAELAAALEIKEEEVESFIEGYLKDNV